MILVPTMAFLRRPCAGVWLAFAGSSARRIGSGRSEASVVVGPLGRGTLILTSKDQVMSGLKSYVITGGEQGRSRMTVIARVVAPAHHGATRRGRAAARQDGDRRRLWRG